VKIRNVKEYKDTKQIKDNKQRKTRNKSRTINKSWTIDSVRRTLKSAPINGFTLTFLTDETHFGYDLTKTTPQQQQQQQKEKQRLTT